MATESDFPAIYKEFLRQHGIPHTLRRDNAKSEDSFTIRDINREHCISDAFTEPHSPWQNPAETSGVRFLKHHAHVLMDRVGAPPSLWFLAHRYVADVYNVTSHKLLKWQTPAQVQGGDTPDISHVLAHYWFEPVLYLDPKAKFPQTQEKPGYLSLIHI